MEGFEFDTVTAVTPIEAAKQPETEGAGEGAGAQWYSATLDADWTIGGKPNGGYLLALLGRSARAVLLSAGRDHPDPIAAAASYVRAPDVGPATIRTEVIRLGRTASQVHASLTQNGSVKVDASLVMGKLDPAMDPRWSEGPPVELDPIEDLTRFPPPVSGMPIDLAIMEKIDLRLGPKATGALEARPSGTAELDAWIRFADGRAPDTLSLLYFADSLPPASLELGSAGWVPTIQLTVYVRAVPAPGPLRARQRIRHLAGGGVFDELCDVWDSRDRLVAQGIQLAQGRFGPSVDGWPSSDQP